VTRTASDLEVFFAPRAVAVLGVSPRPDNLARNIVLTLRDWGFPGEIIPVGSAGEIAGVPIVPSVADLPAGVDLACVLTPAASVPGLIEELGRRGVRAACILSSGFAELDENGQTLAARTLAAARGHGMRLVGPNCLGTMSTRSRLCTPFSRIPRVRTGPVALVCQSGGVLFSYLRDLQEEHIGLSKAASVGNKLDVDEVDLVRYLSTDDETRVISLYLEDIRRGRALMAAAAACPKPIVLHKVNRSQLSRGVAASHTASLLTDHAVVEAAAAQCGIVTVDDTMGALRAIKGLLLPPLRGPRVAVISRSGGHAVIAADACAQHGLQLPALPSHLLEGLRSRVRAGVIRLGNPLDLGDLWSLEAYKWIVGEVAALEEVDGVLFVFVSLAEDPPGATAQLVEHAAEVSRRLGKPIAFSLMSWRESAREVIHGTDWPIFSFVEEAVAALALQRDYHERRLAARVPELAPEATVSAPVPLGLERCLALLERHELPLVATRVARDPEEAARLAEELASPVALKIVSTAATHKTDVGGVCLDLRGADAVQAACGRMTRSLLAARPGAAVDGFVVQRMAAPGLEMIVGYRRDPVFGPLILVGLGGTLVEVLRDVALRIAPVTPDEALRMLDQLHGAPLLRGARGSAPLDRAALAGLVARFSRLAMSDPPLARELELNPVIVYPEGEGCLIVDVRGAT
jgi:acetate---CoA ligase (ADP-forming)